MGVEATHFMKKLAGHIATKTGQPYPHTISFLRRRLRFDLLKTTLIALRGQRGKFYNSPKQIDEMDLNIHEVVEN